MKKKPTARAETLPAARPDALHDAGGDMSAHVDLSKAARQGRDVQRVNVDFPVDLLREIDRKARRSQAFIKVRLGETLVKVGRIAAEID